VLPRAAAPVPGERRIAYYVWHFPVLSQTFVNRELAALKRAGVHLDVVADEPEDAGFSDPNAALLQPHACYLYPADPDNVIAFRRRLFRRRPLVYLRVLLFVLLSRHVQHKRFDADRYVFAKAFHLASVLADRGATHVHAPWADQCALLALMASRLLGIPYSVQARAHEIHRRPYRFALPDIVRGASFVVTNTRYNEAELAAMVGAGDAAKIRVINNGIDLDRFVPPRRAAAASLRDAGRGRRVDLVCVARLIEQKGLVHLLDACSELERRGVDFACEIIGAPEEPLYTNYLLELKRRHRALGLAGRVAFAGAQPLSAVIERFRAADIFVLPCVVAADGSRDITPNALKEAMAMGLPVVSTPIGGVPEIVEDGISGVLVPPADAIALADALAALIADPRRCAALGAAARRRIEGKFDITRNVRRYVELFAGTGPVARPATGAAAAAGIAAPPAPAPAPEALARAPGD
jgi:glycosyltransferase involved in cell wall biosynthesis